MSPPPPDDEPAAAPAPPAPDDATAPCPCSSGAAFAACCAPLLAGAPAPTALALMRSRYTAYVRGDIDYVVATHDAATRARIDLPATTRWSKESIWLGLHILGVERGGPDDDDGVVEFLVRGITGKAPFAQRERSTFKRDGGRWYYVGGDVRGVQARRPPVPGRNDPCPCGSGKKFKICHGR